MGSGHPCVWLSDQSTGRVNGFCFVFKSEAERMLLGMNLSL